jgi:hypothetical protein
MTTSNRAGWVACGLMRGLVALCVLGHAALAAEPAAQPTKNPQQGAGDAPESLAGPKVSTKANARSLVRRDGMGRLVNLEVNPAQAALEIMQQYGLLSDQEQVATRAVIVARAKAFDALFEKNIGALVNVFNDVQSGKKRQAFVALKGVMEKHKGEKALGPVTDQLAAVLPAEKAAVLTKLVDAYADAAMEQERADAKSEGEPTGDESIALRVSLRTLGAELGGAYQRTLVQGGAEFDKLIKDLELTSEQEGKLRTRVQEALTSGEPGVSQNERTAIFMDLWRDLSAEQRKKLAAAMRERR